MQANEMVTKKIKFYFITCHKISQFRVFLSLINKTRYNIQLQLLLIVMMLFVIHVQNAFEYDMANFHTNEKPKEF